MDQKKKLESQISRMERLQSQCSAVLGIASRLDPESPSERQRCRYHMRALRELLGEMKIMSIQVEIYLAEYSEMPTASNDDR